MAKAGDGTVQYVSNTLELPKVLLGQAVNLSEEYSVSESVVPVITKKAKLMEGLGILPRLDGYVGLHAKDYATVYISTDEGDPIYAASIIMRQLGHIMDETETVFAVSYSGEYDAFYIENSALMSSLSDLTGGMTTDDVSVLTEVRFDDKRTYTVLSTLLCVLVTILFFAGIVIRIFTVNDFKRYHEIISCKIRALMKKSAEY